MPSLTLAIPDNLRQKMKRYPEINWSEIARQAIVEKTRLLERINKILSAGPLTRQEALRAEKEIKKRVWKTHQH